METQLYKILHKLKVNIYTEEIIIIIYLLAYSLNVQNI